jgi:hypothetical protein
MPAESDDVANSATPELLRATVPKAAPESLNVTVPVGVLPLLATFADKVTVEPTLEGLADDVKVVAVATGQLVVHAFPAAPRRIKSTFAMAT